MDQVTEPPKVYIQKGEFLEQAELKETQILSEKAIPTEERLEKRAESLADKLLDDAEQVLADPDEVRYDKHGNEYYDTTSRRKYVATVVGIVTKMVQGKQSIKLKKSEETRNNASFLMDLLKKAQSGQLNMDQINSISPKNEQTN